MNKGSHIVPVPCDIGDTVYKISHKNYKVNKWYVFGIQKVSEKQGWVVLAKNNHNKYKYIDIKISFDDFGKVVFLSYPEAKAALDEYTKPVDCVITHKCGHTRLISLHGTPKYRENKIKWLCENLCPECMNKKSEEQGYPLVEMSYKEYKKQYADCDTKVDSYDPESKTILVYLKT